MRNLHIVNLSNYVQPEIKEQYGKDWVTYGKKNEYFQYLIDRSMGSGTNGAIVQSIIDLIYGEGLSAKDKALKPDEYAKLKSIFKDEDVYRMVNDLKRMGQCAVQVIYANNHTNVVNALHIPVECLAAEKLQEDETEVKAYYYAPDWTKVRGGDDVERIPAFGTSNEGKEILYIKPYNSGMFYYSVPDNHGGLQYAELEEEIGNFHINNVKNAFAPSMLINYNNGVPDEEQQAKIVAKTRAKYEGSSNAGRVIIAFNDNKESAATIEAVQLSDASDQYQFLSDECMRKILVSHRVTSPLLLGISTNTGFGSNADELKTASLLFEHQVIRPFRQLLIRGFNKILAAADMSLKLDFESINPFDAMAEEQVEAVKMSSVEDDFDDDDMFNGLDELGEDEDLVTWEIVDEREVNYDDEERLDSFIVNLATTGTARPNAKSEQDGVGTGGDIYKVRYQYAPLQASSKSRDFCRKMVTAKKIYRKEDIQMMSSQSVNPGFGENGAATYDVWLYKGGPRCHHKWFRKTYRLREGATSVDVNNPNAETVSTGEARRSGFYPPANDSMVSIAPNKMPNKGFSPNNPNKPKDAS